MTRGKVMYKPTVVLVGDGQQGLVKSIGMGQWLGPVTEQLPEKQMARVMWSGVAQLSSACTVSSCV